MLDQVGSMLQLKKRDGRQRDWVDQTGIPRRPMGGIEQPLFIPVFAKPLINTKAANS